MQNKEPFSVTISVQPQVDMPQAAVLPKAHLETGALGSVLFVQIQTKVYTLELSSLIQGIVAAQSGAASSTTAESADEPIAAAS